MSLHESIETLHKELVRLVGQVDPMVSRAVASLSSPDPGLLVVLQAEDKQIDQHEVAIEEECLRLFALQHPVAKDLRRVMTCLKITGELERIADLSVNIAERAHALVGQPAVRLPEGVDRMAAIALRMLEDAIHAYLDWNADVARDVCRRDDGVDALAHSIIDTLKDEMRDPRLLEPALVLMWAMLHLERIADHATNIAEDVVYMVTGRIVRHGGGRS